MPPIIINPWPPTSPTWLVTSQVRVTSDDEPHRNPVRHHQPWSMTKLCNHYINCGSTRRVTQDHTSGISWCRACCLFVAWWSLMFWWFAGKNYEDFCLCVAPCQELGVWRLRRVCLNESSDSWNAKRTPAKILDSEKTMLATIGDEGICESCHFASTPFSKSPHFVCWLLLCDSYSLNPACQCTKGLIPWMADWLCPDSWNAKRTPATILDSGGIPSRLLNWEDYFARYNWG
jgi:hypothetical protein